MEGDNNGNAAEDYIFGSVYVHHEDEYALAPRASWSIGELFPETLLPHDDDDFVNSLFREDLSGEEKDGSDPSCLVALHNDRLGSNRFQQDSFTEIEPDIPYSKPIWDLSPPTHLPQLLGGQSSSYADLTQEDAFLGFNHLQQSGGIGSSSGLPHSMPLSDPSPTSHLPRPFPCDEFANDQLTQEQSPLLFKSPSPWKHTDKAPIYDFSSGSYQLPSVRRHNSPHRPLKINDSGTEEIIMDEENIDEFSALTAQVLENVVSIHSSTKAACSKDLVNHTIGLLQEIVKILQPAGEKSESQLLREDLHRAYSLSKAGKFDKVNEKDLGVIRSMVRTVIELPADVNTPLKPKTNSGRNLFKSAGKMMVGAAKKLGLSSSSEGSYGGVEKERSSSSGFVWGQSRKRVRRKSVSIALDSGCRGKKPKVKKKSSGDDEWTPGSDKRGNRLKSKKKSLGFV